MSSKEIPTLSIENDDDDESLLVAYTKDGKRQSYEVPYIADGVRWLCNERVCKINKHRFIFRL
jgi:hypothetical protein